MRKLMWFTVGFGSACALSSYKIWDWDLPVLCGAALLFGLAAMLLSIRWKKAALAAAIMLGVMGGFGWFSAMQRFYLAPIMPLDGTIVPVTVTATSYSRTTPYGSSVEGTTELSGKRYSALIYLDGEPELAPGDAVDGVFRLRLTTPGGKKEATYYQGKGVFLVANQKGAAAITHTEKPDLRYLPARFSQRVRDILRQCLPKDVFPFAQALLLGDTSELGYRMDTAFKVSGLKHVMAVSGLHVAILFGFITWLTGNRRFLTALVGIPALAFFAAMAGFTPSVCRASIMLGLMMLARLLDREYDPLTELSAAGLVLLIGNPMVITSVSFQLSVASVAGILLFQPKLYRWFQARIRKTGGNSYLARVRRWFMQSTSVTLSAMSLSTPLLAWYFGAVSLVSPLTNLLVLWAVSLIFYGILLVAVLGFLWLPAGIIFGKVVARPIRYVLHVARFMSSIPMAAVYTKSRYIVLWIIFCYVLFFLSLLTKRKKPVRYAALGLAALCAAVVISWVEPKMDGFRVSVLDVGQGQSVVLQSAGQTFLVDCGGTSDTQTADTVAETLLSQNIYRLDGVLLTHYDRDHAGALNYLLSRVKAEQLILPIPGTEEEREKAERMDCDTIRWAENASRLPLGEGTVTFYPAAQGNSGNENSTAILFETANCGILITGDLDRAGELALLTQNDLPVVDILVAGHHGSQYSTSEELLRAVRPKTVIISVGAGNTYGHPAPETLARLEAFGCTVLRTDEQGTILYRR